MELQTKRLILRPWQESDAEALYKYACNPNIGPIAGWPPHTSIGNSREIIKGVLSAPETYAVVLKETGETIGSVGIMTARSEIRSAKMAGSECEIGYWISEPYWGQGLIPEAVSELIRYAFEDLQMTTVWCGYFDGNEKSKRVQEKCGFTYSHTEYNKPVPLMNDVRTEHFTKLTLEEWRKEKTDMRIGSIDIEMFAPCGMNCTVCYKHCHTRKIQKPCSGCMQENKSKPVHCRKCRIKDCVQLKEITYCYQCGDFPCRLIRNLEKVITAVTKKVWSKIVRL